METCAVKGFAEGVTLRAPPIVPHVGFKSPSAAQDKIFKGKLERDLKLMQAIAHRLLCPVHHVAFPEALGGPWVC